MKKYSEVYQGWLADPEKFWMDAAEKIDWFKKPTRASSDLNDPLCKWFSDGEVNTCYNALDRHVKNGRAEQTAIIYDSPVTGVKEKISYSTLLESVSLLAGALLEKGGTTKTETGYECKSPLKGEVPLKGRTSRPGGPGRATVGFDRTGPANNLGM